MEGIASHPSWKTREQKCSELVFEIIIHTGLPVRCTLLWPNEDQVVLVRDDWLGPFMSYRGAVVTMKGRGSPPAEALLTILSVDIELLSHRRVIYSSSTHVYLFI